MGVNVQDICRAGQDLEQRGAVALEAARIHFTSGYSGHASACCVYTSRSSVLLPPKLGFLTHVFFNTKLTVQDRYTCK